MKIGEIRRVIERAYNARQWLTGSGIIAEFVKQDVGPQLRARVEELRALVIAPRFAADIERRAEEIERCERVIARWEAYRAEGITDARDRKLCMDGGPRHVYVGNDRCTLCNKAHTDRAEPATVRTRPNLALVVNNV